MALKKGDTTERQCSNPKCSTLFKPIQAVQKYCSPKCRRRIQHITHMTKYPEERQKLLQKLMEYIKTKPYRRRYKKNAASKVKYPTWLIGV